MNQSEAELAIRNGVNVTRQRVLIAKAIIFSAATRSISSEELITRVLKANDISLPATVVIHESVDTASTVRTVIESLSWRLAASEAIWSLIHGGFLFPLSEARGNAPSIGWTTVIPGSGGMSAGWTFDEFVLPVPGQVRRAPSAKEGTDEFLSEPDLYMHSLGVANMHPDVASSFHEAVKCFRTELFTAALAMLGKASEGAWLELGASLLRIVPSSDEAKYSKQRGILEDPMMGPLRKVEAVLTVYDHQELFGPLAKACGVRLQDLRTVAIWSDAVRDSRNTIHFGVTPATLNTYEKLAALLIGAVPHVRMIYRVKEGADAL
ncbi:MAG TPA: hypothetical protein PKA30_13310 [Accumulibacter sp.]|uniref:hypothetical protein n=1 Tax=Pseudomonadota TaxID=1224 RepID=UPI002C7F048F|nr:hypothetical protein [Accumulibacter sp.]HMV06514.1 hypothetical protein [Accumulibacter sp.]